MTIATAPAAGHNLTYDVDRVRADFPALHQEVHGRRLAYLDSAASAMKPQSVIDAVSRVYARDYSNVHRGIHSLSGRATDLFEHARQRTRDFINAAAAEEIVFTRGATESINLVAASLARAGHFRAGDEILITGLEHHANIVPWHLLQDDLGVVVRMVPVRDDGTVGAEDVAAMMTERTRLVSVVHVSNILGTVLPVRAIAAAARERGIPVLIDGCQAAPHERVDVQEIGCDFYVFSAHKVYGPNGVGVLWGRKARLDAMPPYQGGGEMIDTVTETGSTFAEPPYRFEAGTPVIAEAIAFADAIDYVEGLGLEAIKTHDERLLARLCAGLEAMPGVHLVGAPPERSSVVSFTLDGAHPSDVGTLLDQQGVAIRTGHHCCQPVLRRFGLTATARASIGLYTDEVDVEQFLQGLDRVRTMFA